MAVDPWGIDASSGAPSYSGQDLRLGTVTPFVAGAGASLGARSGVRPSGSGTDLLVQAQASPNMTVKVNPGVIVVQGSISSTQGAYTWANDTTLTRSIAAAHATLSRTDLVAVRIRDANVDTSGGRDGDVIVITGTAGGGVPSLPTDATYFTLAQITVPAAASSIVAGNITDKRQYTTGLGGVLLCDANSEPSASSVPASQLAYRSDLGVFRAPSGSSWRMVTPYRQVQVLSSTASTITFSGLPSGAKNITVRVSARSDAATLSTPLYVKINNDSAGNYYGVINQVLNSTVSANNAAAVNQAQVGIAAAASAGVGHWSETVVEFTGWSRTDRFLNFLARSATYPTTAGSWLWMAGWEYAVTGTYSSIVLSLGSGNFVSGTEAVLEAWD